MKYLKKFERLSLETLNKTASKLTNIGHRVRADKVRSHMELMREKERLEKYGSDLYTIGIWDGKTTRKVRVPRTNTNKQLPNFDRPIGAQAKMAWINIDEYSISDNISDYMETKDPGYNLLVPITIGIDLIIDSVDSEEYPGALDRIAYQCGYTNMDELRGHNKSNPNQTGSFHSFTIDVELVQNPNYSEEGGCKFTDVKINGISNSWTDTEDILLFGDRKSALKFKKLLAKCFDYRKGTQKNLSKNNPAHEGSKVLYDLLVDNYDFDDIISTELYQKICETIINIPINLLYRDVINPKNKE